MIRSSAASRKLIYSWLCPEGTANAGATPLRGTGSASWLNAVENFFSALTRRTLRRGVFKSVPDLQKTIRDYIKCQNADPKPFVWTKSAEDIFVKLNELRVVSV